LKALELGQAVGYFIYYAFTRRSRRALPTTDTELTLIAAAAIIGLSSRPKKG
jgi:hypothetical protein